MSLLDVKTKEIIFAPSGFGPRVIMHDFRSLRAAEKMATKALKSMPDHMELHEDQAYKLSFETSFLDPKYHVYLEPVG